MRSSSVQQARSAVSRPRDVRGKKYGNQNRSSDYFFVLCRVHRLEVHRVSPRRPLSTQGTGPVWHTAACGTELAKADVPARYEHAPCWPLHAYDARRDLRSVYVARLPRHKLRRPEVPALVAHAHGLAAVHDARQRQLVRRAARADGLAAGAAVVPAAEDAELPRADFASLLQAPRCLPTPPERPDGAIERHQDGSALRAALVRLHVLTELVARTLR